MICQGCGKTGTDSVTSELDMGAAVFRQRVCSCGRARTTVEVDLMCDLKFPQITSNNPKTTLNPHQTAPQTRGAMGGSESLSGSEADPDPSKLSDQLKLVSARESNASQQKQKKRRKRGKNSEYPPNFEVIWEETGGKGTKSLAYRAWQNADEPAWDAISSTWRAYVSSVGPDRQYWKDLSSWLNQGCHTQEWKPRLNGAAVREAEYDRVFGVAK